MIGLDAPYALLVILPLLYLWWRLGRGPRDVWPLRIAMLLACALMAASPVLRGRGGGRRIVFLVDRSLSAGRQAVATGTEMLELAFRKKAADDQVLVVTFGDGASAFGGRAGSLSELRAPDMDDASDLSAGLALAGSLCSGGRGGRICLISDGLCTGPDPMEHVPELLRNGVTVDFSAVEVEGGNDVAVAAVELPERVSVGHPFELACQVSSPRACEAVLRVESASSSIEQEVQLQPGRNRFIFRDAAGRTGLAGYAVTVTTADDVRPENNTAAGVTLAVGPPEVLVINSGGGEDNLTRALAASGVRVRIWRPGVRVTSAALKPFSAVILENVPLSQLNDRADAALRNYVADMGGGLLVTGGKRSFAAGGYYQSRLDPVLPVSMARKEEYRRAHLAMCIVLDRSGSMAIMAGRGVTKMDLANRAAAEAVSLLMPQDEVAVFAVDSMAHRVVGLTPLGGNLSGVRKRILRIESMGGGIFVYEGLKAAVAELLKSKAPSRHIVLFADAADAEEPGDYRTLVGKWTKAGGTITVVGLGTRHDVDANLLKDIAKRGGGVAMFTTDPHALPRIFCEDAMRVARKTFLEQETAARVTPEVIRIGELEIDRFPSFLGYNLCYTKKDAARIVVTTDENTAPVLAVWQRGVGRVAALTCEADGAFSGQFGSWTDYKPFFSSVAKWLQREREEVSLFGSIRREGRTAKVFLEMDSLAARRCAGATALIIPPDESEPFKLPLHWNSPRSMEASFKLRKTGVYHGLIVTRDGKRVGLPAVVLPYSPEFEPQEVGSGEALLQKLAAATGGKRTMHVGDLFERLPGPSRRSGGSTSLASLLAALVAVLLLCDIVTRKALWGHLTPGFVKSGYRSARDRAGAVSRRVARRLARLRARERQARTRAAPGPEPGGEPGAEPEEEAPAQKESVFDRAKRRSRR